MEKTNEMFVGGVKVRNMRGRGADCMAGRKTMPPRWQREFGRKEWCVRIRGGRPKLEKNHLLS